jgi:hypothetical protein
VAADRSQRAARAPDAATDAARGQALWDSGDWDGAIAAFERVVSRSADGPLPADLAWQLGALDYLRDDTAKAEAVLGRADLDGAEEADAALVLAWLAAAVWRRGDVDAADPVADRAMATATRCATRVPCRPHTSLGH